MKCKGFIFDLDGVIVDTAKYHYLAWKKLAEGLGISFSESQNEELKGVSRVRSLEKILEWGNHTISEDSFMELMGRKNNEYLEYISAMSKDELLPDVEKTLNFLIDKNQKIGLGSASKNAREILKKVDLIDRFETIVDGNSVTKAKPDPEVFLKAASNLGMNPIDCIVFEDARAGIEAANSCGMLSIGLGDKQVLKEANFVFKDFTEITSDFLVEIINNTQVDKTI